MKLRAIIISLALLAFLTAAIGGVLYYYSMMDGVLVAINEDVNAQMEEMSARITLYLSENQKIAAAMAGLKEVIRAFDGKRSGSLTDANSVLDQFQRALNADVCYLIDRSGKTIASSNRNMPESFVGKNYAFRPYFQQAMNRTPSAYPALGVVTARRGVYFSSPVYAGGEGGPAGVVVIKKPVDYLDREIQKDRDGIKVLVNPEGVIFVSNRPEWLYHVLWEKSPGELEKISATRQFGSGPFAWTGLRRTDAQHAVSRSGDKYLVQERRIITFPEWKIVSLLDEGLISRRTSALFFRQYGYVIIAFCVAVALTGILLYRKASLEMQKRKAAEEEIRGINDRLEALIKSSPLAIVIVDRRGIVTRWNPAAEQVYGWREREIVGKFLEIVPGEKRAEFMGLLQRVFEGESFRAVEAQRVRKDGSRLTASLSVAPLHNARGEVVEAIGICEDITDRKIAEEERLKGHVLESIGILAGGIAHDFNNLLTVMVGNIRLAKMSLKPGETANERLTDAEHVCEMAGDLTKRLLTFATGGDNAKKTASLRGLIVETVGAALSGTTIQADLDIPEDLHPVAMDESQMKQVFRNLAINAEEAMQNGGTFTVAAGNIEVTKESNFPIREGRYVKIELRDTGVGIPENNLAKIFDPYYSTKNAYSKKGLGLGLAVCYSVIKRHDGLITVESEAGKGTTYVIYLPAASSS